MKVTSETNEFRQNLKLLDHRGVSRHNHQQSTALLLLLWFLLISRQHQELIELGLYGRVPAFEPNEGYIRAALVNLQAVAPTPAGLPTKKKRERTFGITDNNVTMARNVCLCAFNLLKTERKREEEGGGGGAGDTQGGGAGLLAFVCCAFLYLLHVSRSKLNEASQVMKTQYECYYIEELTHCI